MRLEELRSELHAQADETPADGSLHRLDEVRDRLQHIQRRRVAATSMAAVAAVAVLIALAVVPALTDDRSARAPARKPPAETTRVDVTDPWVWRRHVAGDTLVQGVVGERGRAVVTRRFIVSGNDLRWAEFCDIRSARGAAPGPLMAYSVNGHDLGATGCADGDSTLGGSGFHFADRPRANRSGWARLGVRPGAEVTVRLWLEDENGGRITRPGVRLGFALYERTGPRIVEDGVTIDGLLDQDGRTYRLTDHTVEELAPGDRSATLAVPASDRARIVRSGLEQEGFSPRSRSQRLLDGKVVSVNVGGGVGGERLPDRGAHMLGVRERNDEVRGFLLIAVYERIG